MENTIAKIATVNIRDGENNKKIIVNFDIINEVLIFEGYCKIKMNNTTNWEYFTDMEFKLGDEKNNDLNFEEISKSIYDSIVRKIQMFELVKAFMHEVTVVEIKDS